MNVPTNLLGIGAIGAGVALLWDKIRAIGDFLFYSVFETVELYNSDIYYSCLLYLEKNSKCFSYRKTLSENYMYLKKKKTYKTCFFFINSTRIYFGKNVGGIVIIFGKKMITFRWNNFMKKKSNEMFHDAFNIDYTNNYDGFFLKNITGGKEKKERNRKNDDAEAPTVASNSNRECGERLLVKIIDAGILVPLYFDKDEFGEQIDIRESVFDDYYLNDNLKLIKERLDKWLVHKEWFKDRSITWKRGLCLYGKPGCGKSSFVLRLSKYLRIPLYVYNLSTLNNDDVIQHWNYMLKPCIVLFEDFDSIFDGRKNISDISQMQQKLTFDTLLNIIDGVNSCDGVITVITTNCLDKIDPAMLRSGRIDDIVEVTALGKDGKTMIAKRILNGHTELYKDLLENTNVEESNADFENKCIKKALEHFWITENKKEK